MRTQATPFAYSIVSNREEGQLIPHAVLRCAKCGSRTTKRMMKAHLPPEVVSKIFKRQGWELDPFRPQSVRCPVCQKTPRDRAETNPNKEIGMAAATVSALNPPAHKAPINEKEAGDKPRLTPEQKILVRRKLDATFDEGKGIYLDGYTDQRIGEETNLPWLAVRELREAAYGPLRSVPELDAIMSEHRALSSRADHVTTDITALRGEIAALTSRIAALGAKFGIRAED